MTAIEQLGSNPVILMCVVAAFGLIFGSFLNVVIHRLPIMLERGWEHECRQTLGLAGAPKPMDDSNDAAPASIGIDGVASGADEAEPYNLIVPRSRCPRCDCLIGALENIPILSYLVLGGKCRQCKARISARYPIVEGLTAIMCALVAWRFGFSIATVAAILLTCALISLAFIDLDTLLLPDNITLPFLWLGLGLNLVHTFTSLESAVIGAIAGYGTLWLVFQAFKLVTGKDGMGYGDFKLTAMLGAWLGWQALPGIILLSSLVGAIIGITLIASRLRERDNPIPFGRFWQPRAGCTSCGAQR